MTWISTGGQTCRSYLHITFVHLSMLRAPSSELFCQNFKITECFLLWGPTFTRLTLHDLFVLMVACSVLQKSTCYRRLQHWEEHLLTWYFQWEITLIIDYCAIKGCKQQRDKHLRQFIIAWYGIALNVEKSSQSSWIFSWSIAVVVEKRCRGGRFKKTTLPWRQFQKTLPCHPKECQHLVNDRPVVSSFTLFILTFHHDSSEETVENQIYTKVVW